jgi:hypothetical protein
MNKLIFPEMFLDTPNFESIVNREKNRREKVRKNFLSKGESMLKQTIIYFISVHSIKKKIAKSAKQGLHEVEIPLKKKFRGNCDLASAFIRFRDDQLNIEVCVSYNQFLDALEDYLFREQGIEGKVLVETDKGTNISNLTRIKLSWENLLSQPVILDFLFDSNVKIDDFDEDETFKQLFVRRGYFPRDGSNLTMRIENRIVSFKTKVSTFSGKKITVRPEHYDEDAIEL